MAQLDVQAFTEQYGLSAALLNSTPELMQLARDAVSGSWDATRFTAKLKNTNWWATTSDTMRKFIDLRNADPATFKQQWDQTAFRLNQLAVQSGMANMLTQGTDINKMNQVLHDATWVSMAEGWTDDRVKSWLGSQVAYRQGLPLGGEAAQNYDKLHTLAYANGRNYSDGWYNTWLQDIGGGRKTIDQAEQQIRNEAAAQYSAFGTQIKAGMNAVDLASPYIRAASQLLELPDGALGLNDKNVQKAMSATQKDGSPYSLWQFQNDVRDDPRWRQTDNAREDAMKQARGVLGDFGFVF